MNINPTFIKGLLLALFLIPGLSIGKVIHVNNLAGDDTRAGTSATVESEDGPVKTFKRALALLKPGDTLAIAKTEEPYREPMRVRIQGTAEAPIIIEGNDAVIDLGTDISDGPWRKEGDFWAIDVKAPKMNGQRAIAFYRGVPIVISKQTPFAGYPVEDFLVKKEGGSLLIRLPDGMEPPFTGTYLPGAEKGVKLEGAKHVIIRNLHVRGASNDGYGLHGKCEGILVENAYSILNGDEGTSAHGSSEAEFRDCLFAWNGSSSGGVSDVHDTVTDYIRCTSAYGRGPGFALKGAKHRLINCYSLGNLKWESANNSLPKDRVEVVDFVQILTEPEATLKVKELAKENPQMALLLQLAKEINWPQ